MDAMRETASYGGVPWSLMASPAWFPWSLAAAGLLFQDSDDDLIWTELSLYGLSLS